MAKVGIDTQTILGQKTGFGYYVDNLVTSLKKVGTKHSYIPLAPQNEKDFSTPQRFYWDQVSIPRLASKNTIDILHQPAFSVPIFYAHPVVATIHDLIAIQFGEDISFWSRQYFGRFMPLTYRFADHIIAISEYTKKDIIDVLHIPNDKISVIYSALDHKVQKPQDTKTVNTILHRFGIRTPFLLYVGTINPRKNLVFLTQVFERVLAREPNLQLVIAGKKGWYYDRLMAEITRLSLHKKVIITDYITDEEKNVLYGSATIFTFPSVYEGFGFPVLEALACGIPVIASDKSSIPEIQGDAGISIDPTDEDLWVKEICRLLHDTHLQKKYAASGVKQATKFSWDTTAKRTIEVYDHVLKRYHDKEKSKDRL